MIKIMVVDDEELILEKIIYLLKNSAIEFESILGAGNGQEALNLIKGGNIPDIILCDIRMPVMNGLQLIENVRGLYPDIRFVVVSGYSEFEYAVKAMQYGVTNYVLKPVKEHELISIVEQIRDKIVKAKQEKEELNQTESVKIENKRMVFEKMLYSLLNDRQDNNSSIRRSLENESDILSYNSYIVSTIKLHTDQHTVKRDVYTELCKQFNEGSGHSWIMENFFGKDSLILIFGGSDSDVFAETAISKTKMIHRLLYEEYHLSTTIGISNVGGDLIMAYHNSIAALKNRFLYGRGSLFYYNTNVFHKDGTSQSFVFKMKLVEQSLGNKDMLKVKGILHQFVEEVFIHHIADYLGETSIDYLFNEYINIIIRFCLKNNIAFLENIQQDIISGKALEGLEDNYAIVKLIEATIDSIFSDSVHDTIENQRNPALHLSVVDHIIHYINRNINEEFTLQTISDKFSINSSYLSRVFKTATGQGFVKYVTELKIARAQELLENGSTGIADIAYGLGFSDQQYFNRVFKKTTGMTPNEARMRSKKSPKKT